MKTQTNNKKDFKHGFAISSKPLKKEATLQTLFNREYKKWYKTLSRMDQQTFLFYYKDLGFMAVKNSSINDDVFWYDCFAYNNIIKTKWDDKQIAEQEKIADIYNDNFKERMFGWIEKAIDSYYTERELKHGEAITLNVEEFSLFEDDKSSEKSIKLTTTVHKTYFELLGIDLSEFELYIINKWSEPGQKLVEFSFKNEKELFDVLAMIFKYSTKRNLKYALSIINTFKDDFQL